jgi:hypothetical protein
LNLGPAIFLLNLLGIVAGILVLIGEARISQTEEVDRLVPKPMARARPTRCGQRVPPYFKYLSNHATV